MNLIQCRDGGIGRRKGLKILRRFLRAGSSPALGTISDLSIEYEDIKKNNLTKVILIIMYVIVLVLFCLIYW